MANSAETIERLSREKTILEVILMAKDSENLEALIEKLKAMT